MEYRFNPEEKLTLAKIQEIIDKKMTLALSDEAKRRIEKCRNYLNQKMENQKVLKQPIVRNGKQATLGYQPEVWKKWE